LFLLLQTWQFLAFCADFSIPAQSRKEILVANTTPLWLLNNKQHNQPDKAKEEKKREGT
jgi:hypothetical protein